MTNEEIISELELLKIRAKELIDEINIYDIPSLRDGECFHGGVWMICPCCNTGMQMVGRTPLLKKNGHKIYRCDECKSLVIDM